MEWKPGLLGGPCLRMSRGGGWRWKSEAIEGQYPSIFEHSLKVCFKIIFTSVG